jgi:aminoglycoside phosphotransferase (APT) family kinase protein
MRQADGSEEQPLAGGIANLGKVVRVGDTVRRPASRFTDSIFALFARLHDVGFDGVPRPLGRDERGREVLTYIEGDVPIPPFPGWSMTDEALASVARLQRRFHEAAAAFDASAFAWSDELADPRGGAVVGHNDICPENVVFRGGEAIALLDWDFVAPGRPLWDIASLMSMWGPVRDPSDPVPGMEGLEPFRRGRLIADAYGLEADARAQIPDVFVDRLSISLVERRAAAGEEAFVEMLARQGGAGRAERRRRWLDEHMDELRAAMT